MHSGITAERCQLEAKAATEQLTGLAGVAPGRQGWLGRITLPARTQPDLDTLLPTQAYFMEAVAALTDVVSYQQERIAALEAELGIEPADPGPRHTEALPGEEVEE